MKIIFTTLCILFLLEYSFCQDYIIMARPWGEKDWGYINLQGEVIIKPQFEKNGPFCPEGLAPIFNRNTKKYNFITLKGDTLKTEVEHFIIANVIGRGMQGFDDGMTRIRVGSKWGYMNTQGKMVTEIKFTNVNKFNGGFATAELTKNHWVIIDKNGSEIEIKSDSVATMNSFFDGLAQFKSLDNKWGFIDTQGNVVISAKFVSVGSFNAGLAWAKNTNDDVGFLDKTGEWAIKPRFNHANDFDALSGLARVKIQKEWCYVDTQGQVKCTDQTERWSNFQEGLAIGRKDGQYGFYDNEFKWVVAPIFQGLRNFKNGFAAVKQDDKWGIIDKKGNWVLKPSCHAIKDVVVLETK